MPNWYWDKKDLKSTPSQEKGLDTETENRYRREGVRFIFELGKAMSLYHLTLATGAVYFHRFYMFHAFQDFPKYVVATCCLFLAGKAEETPKKCRDIVRMVRTLTNDKQFATFGVDPKEEIMVLERVLLQTIKFDLQVDHPYASIIRFAKSLKGDSTKLQKMVQMSWTFINDSLSTTLCLQWEPEIIAIAVMHLAIKLSKFEVKDWANRKDGHKEWWDQYVENLETSDLEEICHQVLDLYGQQATPAKDAADSPPRAPVDGRATASSSIASTTTTSNSGVPGTSGQQQQHHPQHPASSQGGQLQAAPQPAAAVAAAGPANAQARQGASRLASTSGTAGGGGAPAPGSSSKTPPPPPPKQRPPPPPPTTSPPQPPALPPTAMVAASSPAPPPGPPPPPPPPPNPQQQQQQQQPPVFHAHHHQHQHHHHHHLGQPYPQLPPPPPPMANYGIPPSPMPGQPQNLPPPPISQGYHPGVPPPPQGPSAPAPPFMQVPPGGGPPPPHSMRFPPRPMGGYLPPPPPHGMGHHQPYFPPGGGPRGIPPPPPPPPVAGYPHQGIQGGGGGGALYPPHNIPRF